MAAVALLMVVLVLTGADSAARLTAAGTLLFAVGTIGLAAGAIGTYVEQRRQITQQQIQLEAAKEADVAQVLVRRLSGPGQWLRVEIANNASRAIRDVYVWADIRNMTGHCEARAREPDPRAPEASGQVVMSRRMKVARVMFGGAELYRCYRAILPGESHIFDQDARPGDSPLPDVDNAWITASAMFADSDGRWWRCTEDGDVDRLYGPPELVTERRSVPRTGIPGLPRFTIPPSDQAQQAEASGLAGEKSPPVKAEKRPPEPDGTTRTRPARPKHSAKPFPGGFLSN